MATQISIDFPDTCPNCKGRGCSVRVHCKWRNGQVSVVESVQPCLLCEAKGILACDAQRWAAKLTLNALYGKFARP